jgi:tartrate dehydrogenase/decarboxylase/D-malate dehydrogenase
MMDADGIDRLMKFDAIYLGAIGDPRVADHISARELILPLRQKLGQWVNLRPMRLMPGISSPLAGRSAADIDMVCVRENSEGEYCGMGGRLHAGTPSSCASRPASSRGTASSASRATRSRWRSAAAQDAGERDQVERAAARDGAVG